MKMHVVVDTESNWIPKQLFLTFGGNSRIELVDDPAQADLIWIMSYYAHLGNIAKSPRWARWARRLRLPILPPLARLESLRHIPILATLAHLVPGKQAYYLPNLRRVEKLADFFHIFCRANAGFCGRLIGKPMFHLPYWIDLEAFFPQQPDARKKLRVELGLPEDRRVIGSFQRDTEPDLVSPKLEKGPDILCDIFERLDPAKHFVLLSGPRRHYVERRLEAMGMPYKSLGFVEAGRMPDLYSAIDLYLVTSRIEGGPQALLECMATRTPIFSTSVGISDCLPSGLIKSSADEFVAAVNQPYPDLLDDNLARVQHFEARRVVASYEAAFMELVAAYRKNPAAPYRESPDLDWVANT